MPHQQYLGVFTRHDYKDSQGNTETKWYKAGYMKLTDNGGRFLRLFHMPQVDYFCFDGDKEPLPEIQVEG